jgi:DNA ligase (NAD+)
MYTPEQEKQLYTLGKDLLAASEETPEHLQEYVAKLSDVIRFADFKYYQQSNPVLADSEYDALFKRLRAIEEAYPEHLAPDSPTQRVALGLSERFPPVAHLVPMLSLDNTYNAGELRDWDQRVRKGLETGATVAYCVEPKYDGASVSIIYEADRLTRGATRGDGVMGEEITTNVKQIRSIPLTAPLTEQGISILEIRGEVVIHKSTFASYNESRAAEGLAPLANPRNAASGTLRILDPREVRQRGLSAVLYHISEVTALPGSATTGLPATHYESLGWLKSMGFPTPVDEMKRFNQIEDVINFCLEFEARRDDLPYEVDGVVIKVDAFAQQDALGMTSHHPRWAVAYKFAARQATSKLRQVMYQVGRTGSITPVAKIDPVAIGGVTVTSVSLFNEDVVRQKDLRIGDTVVVERAGDVIPYIVQSLPDLRDGTETPIVFPAECPKCGATLDKPLGEAAWRCINAVCPAQVLERVIHFCSKDAMDIRGMGEANVKKLLTMGLISDPPSLYHIDWAQVRGLEGFKDKSVANLQQAIDASKAQPLQRLIFGLGIRHVGETTARTLANRVGHLTELYSWGEDILLTLEDVGPKVAASIVHFFSSDENRKMIERLNSAGVNLANTQKGTGAMTEGALKGKTFLFTGTLARLKRSEAEGRVEELGGTILTGVSSKLNYLVVGTDAGSKLEKAKKLGTVTILTEDEFISMVQTPDSETV